MVNVKLGDKVFEGVTSVKLNTTDGDTATFIEENSIEPGIIPEGTLNIDKNGDYNVSEYEKVSVKVPTYIVVSSVDELPTDAEDGTIALIGGA